MKKEKGVSTTPSETNLNTQLTMENYKSKQFQTQPESRHLPFRLQRLVCDECARPLYLYGENFIDSYTDGRANVLRCLCDIHADEMEVCE